MQQANKDIVLKLLGGDENALNELENQLRKVGERTAGAITRTASEGQPASESADQTATAVVVSDTLELALTEEQYNGLVEQVVDSIRTADWFQPLLGLQAQLESISQTIAGLTEQFSGLHGQLNGMQEASSSVNQRLAQAESVLTEVESHYRSLQPVAAPRIFTVRPGQPKTKTQTQAQPGQTTQAAAPTESQKGAAPARWKRTGLFESKK